MFRISILCRLAVQNGFIDAGETAGLIDSYKEAIKTEPNLPFMQWAVKAGRITREQAGVLKEGYPGVHLDCLECSHAFKAGDTDIRKPLVCPNCGAANLVVKDEPGPSGAPLDSTRTLLEFHTAEHAMPSPGSPLSTGSSVPGSGGGDFVPSSGATRAHQALSSASDAAVVPPPPPPPPPGLQSGSGGGMRSDSSVLGESFGAPPPTLGADGTL
ncbi:MAG: hypothetical protein AB7K09_26400, partial [Planctomycetota bacterium]